MCRQHPLGRNRDLICEILTVISISPESSLPLHRKDGGLPPRDRDGCARQLSSAMLTSSRQNLPDRTGIVES